MRAWFAACLIAMAALCAGPARAGLPETPRPRQFTVADGLPSNRINALAEDRQGYLWIATSDGLARFDGVGFRIWRIEQGLRDNFVWSVHVDARDRVWVGTRSAGLAMLDASRTRFTHYDRRTPGVGGVEVWSIASDAAGDVWFGTADAGLHRLRDGRVTRYMPVAGDPRSLPDAGIRQIEITRDGSVWVGTVNGVARWTPRGIERLPPAATPSPVINGLSSERDGTLWIGTARGVAVRRPDGRTSATPWAQSGRDVLHVLLRDRFGSFWFDIPEGLGVDNEGRVGTVPLYSATSRGLVRPSWVDAHEDRDGGLWFASNTSGLWYLPTRWRQFSVLARTLGDASTLANAQVRGIAPSSDGSVWLVGSGGVLDRFDSETGAVEHVVNDVGDGFVLVSVLEDREGRVWVTFPDGMARVDPRNREVRRWGRDGADAALAGETVSLLQADDGAVWLAGEGGLQVRDGSGRVLRAMVPGDRHGLPAGSLVHRLRRTPGGRIWAATSRGLYAWSPEAARFAPVRGPGAAAVHDIAMDERGDLWLARFAAVERYRPDAGRLRRLGAYGRDAGFPRVAPTGLTVDSRGIAWVTTVRGLVRLDPAQGRSRIYGVRDGLPSQEFSDPPVARPSDGRILVGTSEGLVVFDPAVVRPSGERPELVIESLDVRRGTRLLTLPASRRFTLAHDDRDLRMRARLMSFSDASTHEYRTRLVGFDRGWVPIGPGGERVFSQLPTGRYRLQVVGRTADHVWSAPREVVFEVQPPWWRTRWAIAAAAMALAGAALILGFAYRQRLRRRLALQRVEQERRLAEEASDAKTRFLATFGHEVRTPMTGVLGMTELLLDTPLVQRQRGYVEAIRQAGEHLLRLLNDALDLARIESGRLELASEPFDLHAMLRDVAALAGPLVERRGLGFVLQVDDDVPRHVLGDASRLRQILLNLLGNAQKFTEEGRIALHARRFGRSVRFSVEDTGPGLDPAQQARLFQRFSQADGARTAARYGGSGLGLAISQELAEAMGGHIDVESTPGRGATFHVVLPLPAAAAPSVPASPSREPAPSRSLTLLLVEDDATVADVVIGLLQAQGHRVHHVPHALAALAEVQVERFDAALLDLDLPGIDGFTLARQLRAGGFTAPLVAVTARADAESPVIARESGFDAFVRKPLTGALLARALADAVDDARR
ncbi:hybrid sensor histidine kinase/response regulator [Lysobacter humi (ex Lee et al. 2017)]